MFAHRKARRLLLWLPFVFLGLLLPRQAEALICYVRSTDTYYDIYPHCLSCWIAAPTTNNPFQCSTTECHTGGQCLNLTTAGKAVADPTTATNNTATRTNTNTATNTTNQQQGNADLLPHHLQLSQPDPSPNPTNPAIAEANKEQQAALAEAAKLRQTMAQLTVQNQSMAQEYRAPSASMGGVSGSPMGGLGSGGPGINLAGGPAVTGKGESESPASVAGNTNSGIADELGNPGGISNARRLTLGGQLSESRAGSSPGRKPSSLPKPKFEAPPPGAGRVVNDPWLAYMAETSSDALVNRLKDDQSLRESLRKRLEDLAKQGNQAEMIGLLHELLEEAEAAASNTELDGLKPMTVQEAFLMDADETRAHIRRLLSDLEEKGELQFLSQESLFKRVSLMHRRSMEQGRLRPAP